MSPDDSNPHQTARETVECLRGDLEPITRSDLSFSSDAKRTVDELDPSQTNEASDR